MPEVAPADVEAGPRRGAGPAEAGVSPPGEPPHGVRSELLWRLATRLYHEHDCRPGTLACVSCGQPWPCSGRRLAELGLIRAVPAPSGG